MLSRLNKQVFEIRNWFESARKYFVIGQKSVLKNDGLFVFLLFPRCAFPPFEGKYFCRNRSSGFGAKLQIPSDFPDLSCFSPAQNNMHNFLVKNLFFPFSKTISEFQKVQITCILLLQEYPIPTSTTSSMV